MRRDPASYTDPHGFVFWEGDAVRRQVHAGAVPFMRQVLANPALRELVTAGKLAEATIEREDGDDLVLAHPRIAPASYPQEWCAPMLADAAQLVLEVAAAAAQGSVMLADGHPWNVFFDGAKPVFLDWGSFAPPSQTIPWPAQAQFDRFMRRPLHLYAGGLPELARARLADLALGVSSELVLKALPVGYWLARPKAATALLAHRTAERLTANPTSQAGDKPAALPRPGLLEQVRPGYFRGLQRDVAAIRLPESGRGWAGYYASCPSMAADEEAEKANLLERLLATERPASVLDIGTNTGRYALMATEAGARVTALDQDEASVAALYRAVRGSGKAVLPLVMDLGNPTPGTGWCARQRPDALARLGADVVLALALIHHLVFTGNHSLEQVAMLLRGFARQTVVVEWVGPEDPMSVFLRRTATKDFGFYTLERFEAALAAEGFHVKRLEPHAPARQLLLARVTA